MSVCVILEESKWILPPYDDPSCVCCLYILYDVCYCYRYCRALIGETSDYFEVSIQAKVIGRNYRYRLVSR